MPSVITPQVQNLLTLCERGATLLVSEDDNVFFMDKVGPSLYFCAEFLQDNYPAFNTMFLRKSGKTLRKELQKNLAGWFVRKNDIGLKVTPGDAPQVADLEDDDAD